jgi:cell division protein FtsL
VSVPAREVEGAPVLEPELLPEGWALALPDRTARPDTSAPPARTPATRPPTDPPSRPRRRARGGLHPTFMVFASVVIVVLVLGVVTMNALFAQTAFAVHSTQTRVTELAKQHDVLATDVARLSSPSRIAEWAEHFGMVLPDDVVILRVPRFGRIPAVTP